MSTKVQTPLQIAHYKLPFQLEGQEAVGIQIFLNVGMHGLTSHGIKMVQDVLMDRRNPIDEPPLFPMSSSGGSVSARSYDNNSRYLSSEVASTSGISSGDGSSTEGEYSSDDGSVARSVSVRS